MNQNKSVIPNNWMQTPVSDEIDLRELVLVLFRQKTLILLVTLLFSFAGAVYAFFAPQIWSANAVIQPPQKKDLLPMLRVASQSKLLGISDFPSSNYLYSEFVREYNAYDNRRDFLKGSSFFKKYIQAHKLDERGQRQWIREWSKFISAEAVDKKGEKPGINLTSSTDTSKQALALLEDYIHFIITKQQQRLINQLKDQQAIQLDAMMLRLKLTKEDAEQDLKREIESTMLTISVASAAGVERPLENYNNGERFPITLGTKGLEAKLRVLQSIDLAIYQPTLAKLKVKINRLKQVSFDQLTFRPFSYLDAPEEPLSRDKPKRSLIVVLSTLLGGMLGIVIALVRHTFGWLTEAYHD